MKLIIEMDIDHPVFDGGEGHIDDNFLRTLFQQFLGKIQFREPTALLSTTGSVMVGADEVVHWRLE